MDHAAVARRREADTPAVAAALPGRSGVFLTGDCAPLRWGDCSEHPIRCRSGFRFSQPRKIPNTPPCLPTRLFPPRRCRHPEFSSSLTSSLGSGHLFLVAPFHRDSRPSVYLESRALPAAASCSHLLGELLGEPLRSLRLHLAHPLTATCLLLRATSMGQAHHLPATWPRQTSPLFPTPGLHLRTVAGALAN